jgi:sporulation protein YlmC with PRC-barrel domain
MQKIILLVAAIGMFVLVPSLLFALDARLETVDGDIYQITDFSMDGRRTFSIDQEGGIGRLDWKEISSFEIKQVGANYWVEVQFTTGKKDTLRLRQHSFFKGRSDFGQVSIPFEKVKKVSLLPDAVGERKKEETPLKETALQADSQPRGIDRVTLRNGDILMGELVADSLTIRTIYGTVVFKKTDISRISFGKGAKSQKDAEKDVLISKYGDKLSGTIPESSLEMNLRTNSNISIPREHIQEIEFGIAPELERKISHEPEPIETR